MRVETLLPIGKVDPGLLDVSMRLDLSSVSDMAREVEALGGAAQAHHRRGARHDRGDRDLRRARSEAQETLRKLRDGDRVRSAASYPG